MAGAPGIAIGGSALARAAQLDRLGKLRLQSPWIKSLAFAAPVAGPAPVETAGAATSITNGVLVGVTDPRLRYEGLAVPDTGTAGFIFSHKTAGTGGGASLLPWRVSWDEDCQDFELKLFASGATSRYRLWADGQPQSATMTTVGATGNRKAYYDFGSRAVRRLTLELSDGLYFGGFWRRPVDTVSHPRDGSPVRFGVLGDSLAYGTGAGIRVNGYVHSLGRLLGWQDTAAIAAGGTGYIQDNASSGEKNYATRLADAVAFAPDILLVAGSQNDQNKAVGAVQAAAQALVTSIRAQLPNTLLIMSGVLYPATPDAAKAQVDAELEAAAAAMGVQFIDTQSQAWFFGTGYSAASGNGVPTRTGTATLTQDSTALTSIVTNAITGLTSGAIVTGAGIPAGTTLTFAGATGTLSQPATASGAAVALTGGDNPKGDGNADFFCGSDKAHPLQGGHDHSARKFAAAIAAIAGLSL